MDFDFVKAREVNEDEGKKGTRLEEQVFGG